jgi:hypothetical protein
MPQGEDHAPKTVGEAESAARLAGWDAERFGPAPFDHGQPVEGLEYAATAPTVTQW